jgi:hypothetical protein
MTSNRVTDRTDVDGALEDIVNAIAPFANCSEAELAELAQDVFERSARVVLAWVEGIDREVA